MTIRILNRTITLRRMTRNRTTTFMLSIYRRATKPVRIPDCFPAPDEAAS